jgi:predicted AAA+ superfamily ATPase
MTNETYCRSIWTEFAGLTVFSGILKHPLVKAFYKLFAPAPSTGRLVTAWARFASVFASYSNGEPFRRVLYRLALADLNCFTLAAERGGPEEGSFVSKIAAADLAALSRAAAFDFNRLSIFYGLLFHDSIESRGQSLGRIEDEAMFLQNYGKAADDDWTPAGFASFIRKNGAGNLAGHTMFYIADGKLIPAGNGDPVRLADLSGYEEERRVVISNTLRFLSAGAANAQEANNILLYGDRGCGKSATVKAVCNEYSDRGLRLVELRKSELASLPKVMKTLGARGLRFILFIDDLSFEADDPGFMTLKAMLEGGVETKPSNVVIYATSNRRHLVKEPRADRPASSGDVRAFDSMQEQLSLADRFGLTVIFSAPDQDEYLRIAEFTAQKLGALSKDAGDAELQRFRENAIRWERWFNGRSPRTAAQFAGWLAGGQDFPWDRC